MIAYLFVAKFSKHNHTKLQLEQVKKTDQFYETFEPMGGQYWDSCQGKYVLT
jgi:hypothetical protein